MRVVERLGDLATDERRLGSREVRSLVEQHAQRSTAQQLDDHERQALVLSPVVDGHDMGMVQRRGELRLRLETPHEPGVVPEPGLEHLDRGRAGATARRPRGIRGRSCPRRSARAADQRDTRTRPTRSATALWAIGSRLGGIPANPAAHA